MMSQGHYIAGTWNEGVGAAFSARDPASGQVNWTGRAATAPEIDQAVAAARAALKSWSGLPVQDRIARLHAFAAQLREHRAELADIISRETGKPRWESASEIESMIAKVPVSVESYPQRC